MYMYIYTFILGLIPDDFFYCVCLLEGRNKDYFNMYLRFTNSPWITTFVQDCRYSTKLNTLGWLSPTQTKV